MAPALGQPPPRAVSDLGRGRLVGPGRRSLCFRGKGAAAPTGDEAGDRDREGPPSSRAKTRVAPGRYRQSQGGLAPYLEPRGVLRGAPTVPGASGRTQPPVHSPRPGRAPLGWRTLVVRGAHHFGRPLARGLGLSRGRTPRGAHPPGPLRDWPGAGSPSCARRLRLPAPPESPPSPGGKKKDS